MPNSAKLMKTDHKWVATCAKGLEPYLAKEITDIGGEVLDTSTGAIRFSGDEKVGYSACLWSRVANQVLLPFWHGEAESANDMFDQVLTHTWGDVMSVDQTFVIDVSNHKTEGFNKKYWAQKLKDAVVDWFVDDQDCRPSVDKANPDVTLHLFVSGSSVEVSISFSGDSLHKRGYRKEPFEGSLKENLASSLLLAAGWDASQPTLMDPMCGSGSFLIEAAMISYDIAPGLYRRDWGFKGWKGFDDTLWGQLVQDAMLRRDTALSAAEVTLIGYDSCKETIKKARRNIQGAGLEDIIRVEVKEFARFHKPSDISAQPGLVIINPPYGERLGEAELLFYTYRALGNKFRDHFKGWNFGIISSDIVLLDQVKLPYDGQLRVFNGPIQCYFRYGEVASDAQSKNTDALRAVLETNTFQTHERISIDLANRLIKNVKKLKKWALKNELECFRIYDADMPEFNFVVDVYGQHIHIQEYAAPKSIPDETAKKRLDLGVETIKRVFRINFKHLFIKVKRRQKGKEQYQKLTSKGELHEVKEHNAHLLVNLSDYVDTGVFLDHRIIRQKIFELAAGKRFLNLFAYTGTASIFAALGGAKSTTTVDLSPTYIAWAKKNFALNGFSEQGHQFFQQDCISWLHKCNRTYDLVFVDPPTFSNSKRVYQDFNVQKDHADVLEAVHGQLEPNGVVIFSNNFQGFELDERVGKLFSVKNISKPSIPLDFGRRPKIHQCWMLTRL
ncbi:MAG: bifunctional 23S rRNA (guanine(2069)-N(7))-methyltransferase RlmK/23S rRNA (guanine(2445)-N(2))-methyltransferase RlmL [Gammaproteobacteria bacterium]|nr:MAG: bifunctional 23S rRNA (guanine(2069)-N(7))-methyltransferase RlmK/23S rRNA (guanine(2445)-N(2))-methyltransferase RlmL [Gammaproteobacteria bacterium]